MKLPSITHAANAALKTYLRFPLVILDAVIGTMCAIVVIDYQGPLGPTTVFPVLFGAVLGFPLLAGLALVAEKRKRSRAASLGLQLVGIAIVFVYALTVPQDLSAAPDVHKFRLFMLVAGAVLFIFSAPYIGHESELGYWNYCKTLCLRIFTAGFFTAVLFVGLAIALLALDKLFGVTIPNRRYPELWASLVGAFATWFVLAGIPEDLESLDHATDYPKGVKIFSQYILLPLVLVYLVILYAYLGKILLAWDWPQGWVSSLILGFIAMGFASLLLTHPVKDRLENAWINRAARWFYIIIIPLMVMLFLAIGRRVSEYGITEDRYLGLATVVWLCIVTPYFLFSRKKRILFLTASLCTIVLAISVGPWGMFAVSEKSQVARLSALLRDNHILVGGRVQAKHEEVSFKSAKEISSIIGYLSRVHGYDAIQPWFAEKLKGNADGRANVSKLPADVVSLMGVQFISTWRTAPGETMTLEVDREATLDIGGYDRLLQNLESYQSDTEHRLSDDGVMLRIRHDAGGMMTVARSRDMNTIDTFHFDLTPLADTLLAEYGNGVMHKIPPGKMAITASGETMMIKVFFPNMTIVHHAGKTTVKSYEAVIAYKVKE